MSTEQNEIKPAGRDHRTWQLAKQRVGFRNHFATYIVIISFLWILWFVNGAETYGFVPWPVWPTIGWGIGIAFHYIRAFINPKDRAVEKEYEKLMREKNNQ